MAADPDARAGACRDREPVCGERVVDVPEPCARADDGLSGRDVHGCELREIDDDAGSRRVAAVAVPAGPGDDVHAARARPANDLAHVGCVERLCDREWVDAVVEAVEDEAGLLVSRRRGCDHRSSQRLGQCTDPRIAQVPSSGLGLEAQRRQGKGRRQRSRPDDQLAPGQRSRGRGLRHGQGRREFKGR